jgi:hypothetical protein
MGHFDGRFILMSKEPPSKLGGIQEQFFMKASLPFMTNPRKYGHVNMNSNPLIRLQALSAAHSIQKMAEQPVYYLQDIKKE